ncbi:transposase, partial [Heyndrickxia sporothermodurans]|uniref:transposase n=2 Tax=Heyndrickxia sporothermodurans TaxID=46224 RepID=UPI002E2923E6
SKNSNLNNEKSGNLPILSYNIFMKKTANSTTPTPTIEELLQRLEMLEKQNAELEAKLKKQSALEAKLKWTEEQLRLLQKNRFGFSSEKTNPDQLELFNEVEK